MSRISRLGWILSAAAAVAGCASGLPRVHAPSDSRYAEYLGAPVEHFSTFNINGWDAVGRDQLIIWTGVNEAYLLTVWDTCQDLLFAEHVSVTSTGSWVTRLDTVRVGRQRCPISDIRPIDLKRMKADRALKHKAAA